MPIPQPSLAAVFLMPRRSHPRRQVGEEAMAGATASAFASVRALLPVALATLSRARPFELSGYLPGCLSVLVPCRSFAAADRKTASSHPTRPRRAPPCQAVAAPRGRAHA